MSTITISKETLRALEWWGQQFFSHLTPPYQLLAIIDAIRSTPDNHKPDPKPANDSP